MDACINSFSIRTCMVILCYSANKENDLFSNCGCADALVEARNRYSMRPSVLWMPCILHKHEDFSCYNYVFYITNNPVPIPCNNNNINRKELYDFYYTAITKTTGYNEAIRHEATYLSMLASSRSLTLCKKGNDRPWCMVAKKDTKSNGCCWTTKCSFDCSSFLTLEAIALYSAE